MYSKDRIGHQSGVSTKSDIGIAVRKSEKRFHRFRAHHPGLRGSSFTNTLSRPMAAGCDLYGRNENGSEFPVEIDLNPIETDERRIVLSATVDISDRKHKEKSIHAVLREKDIMLGKIYQPVKNNLQIVHGLLDLQSSNISDLVALGLMLESQNRIRSMALIHQTLYKWKDFARVHVGYFLHALMPTLGASARHRTRRSSGGRDEDPACGPDSLVSDIPDSAAIGRFR